MLNRTALCETRARLLGCWALAKSVASYLARPAVWGWTPMPKAHFHHHALIMAGPAPRKLQALPYANCTSTTMCSVANVGFIIFVA